MLISIIFFLFIALAIISGLVAPTVKEFKVANDLIHSKQSYALSESGIEDVFYRLRENIPIGSSTTLTLGDYSATTTVSDSGFNQKTIASTGDVLSRQRSTEMLLTTGAGVSFNYGVQVGNGGFDISGGAGLTGNIYSNGPIIGTGSVTITGTAISAEGSTPTAQYVNDTPMPNTEETIFGQANSNQDFAQSFTMTETSTLSKIAVYIRKYRYPGSLTVRISPDDNGHPNKSSLATASLSNGLIGTSFGWVEVSFSNPPDLDEGETYWVVLDGGNGGTGQWGNWYEVASNDDITGEEINLGRYNNEQWNDAPTPGDDGYFRIYTGGIASEIYGTGNYVGAINVTEDAWADSIRNASVGGEMWCNTSTNTNQSCDTSHGIAPQVLLPVSDSNINTWKDAAEAGGTHTGNVNVNWSGDTLGPLKITGDLTINGGGTLTLTGPLWVEGDFTITGGGKIVLNSSYGDESEVIVVDGLSQIDGGTNISGSGTEGSYTSVLSTNTASNAVNLSGGAGAVVLMAPYGTININGGTGVKSVVAYKINLSGGAQITYEDGLADINFSSGPSGSWSVDSYKEVE